MIKKIGGAPVRCIISSLVKVQT